MYFSYTTARNYFGQLTNDTSSGNLTNGDTHINADIGRVLGKRPWPFLFREGTVAQVASQQWVAIPANIKKVTGIQVTSGSTVITPREAPSREFWNRLNAQTPEAYKSDWPNWWYFFNGRVYFSPTPSTANTVSFVGRKTFGRLNIADYTTGNVTSAAHGSTRISGTTAGVWTRAMEGRFLRVTAENNPDKGDDEWYEVETVIGGTTLNLVKPYEGISITQWGTAAYTMGQIVPLPDGYQEIPIYNAVSVYYGSKGMPGAADKATYFKGLADNLESQMESDYANPTDNVLVDEAEIDDDFANPNLYVRL